MIENILIGILVIALLYILAALIYAKGDTSILRPLGVPARMFLVPVIVVLPSIWIPRLFETYMPPEIYNFFRNVLVSYFYTLRYHNANNG